MPISLLDWLSLEDGSTIRYELVAARLSDPPALSGSRLGHRQLGSAAVSDPSATRPSPCALLDLAIDVADEAVRMIRTALSEGRGTIDAKSSSTDLVTATDRAVEAMIVRRILAVRPNDGFLGEEGAADPGTSGVRWIVDPIDGTTNFVFGYPAFCTSVAAEVDGVVVAGCVHDAVSGERFTATQGGGAEVSCPDRPDLAATPLAVRAEGPPLGEALVGTGFGYGIERRMVQGGIAGAVLPRVRDLRRSGSCALDLCWLAAGRLDAYFERGPHRWDVAAAGLIAMEAGAWLGALEAEVSPNDLDAEVTIVAARPDLRGPLLDLLREVGAGGELA